MQHIFETRRGHPEHLYAEMLSLAGCPHHFFHQRSIPRDLPKYDHDDLAALFWQAG